MRKGYTTFEEYLQEEFMKEYSGHKDDAWDAFDSWLSVLDIQEVIDFAEKWGELTYDHAQYIEAKEHDPTV